MYRTKCRGQASSFSHSHYGAGGRDSWSGRQSHDSSGQGRARGRGRGVWSGRSSSRGGKGRGSTRGFTGAYSLDSVYVSNGWRSNSHQNEGPVSEGRGQSSKFGDDKLRKFPIGIRALDRLTNLQPDIIILQLLSEKFGFRAVLEQDNMPPNEIDLVVKVLADATSSQSNKEGLNELLNRSCHQKFIDNLLHYSLTIKRQYPHKSKVFFTNVLTFLEAFTYAIPTVAVDRIQNFVESSHSTLVKLQPLGYVDEDLVKKYEGLQNVLTEVDERWMQKEKFGGRGKKNWKIEMDHMEPPDDFRELSVLPTPMDLAEVQSPFLRRNVLHGQYNDGQHYLDVQFRLLREDFVRPLRNGINKFKNDKHARIMDVRIYRDVAFIGPKILHKKLIIEVHLGTSRRITFENSKRLLFGNLLCFSKDNFQQVILGSVAERDPEKLKQGIIGVEFESDLDNYDTSGIFLMVESRSYFMAYKHVLQTLKDMPESIPMERYVVHVDPNIGHPQYMAQDQTYDLRVVRSMKVMKGSEAFNMFLRQRRMNNIKKPRENEMTHLRNVCIGQDLSLWPSEHDLGLDQSQRRALRSALTRELAIIQGPPGTGKTFIGLKIVQILLHNSDIWKVRNDPTPILVTCFTNHALDQFLEGITQFTSNIVRVGSRTQSENVERFQINKLVKNVTHRERMPDVITSWKSTVNDGLKALESEIRFLRQVECACDAKYGIICCKIFELQKVIPDHVLQQISKTQSMDKITNWLTCNYQSQLTLEQWSQELGDPKETENSSHQGVKEVNIEEQLRDENLSKDAKDLREVEERDRMIEQDESEDIPASLLNTELYEVTKSSLIWKIENLWTVVKEGIEKFFPDYIMCCGLLEAIEVGLDLRENDPEARALEEQAELNIWSLDAQRKFQLYNFWVKRLAAKVKKHLKGLQAKYKKKMKAWQEVRNQEYLYAMRQASVVGMTTSGAAQHSSILQDLAPAIVVIEEAAEILEPHVITSLTSKCQHLIMIGDHKQLRPSATVYELATKYGLETSLFERLIKNGLAYETLEYQHRMRPSISSLLVPSIYATLKDHPLVQEYPSITGVTNDLFFISHQIHELEESDDNNSHENQHEAELLIGLCRHLMLQGYSPDDVTILTPYSGQFFLLRKLQRWHSACSGVKICVVDNFQGEENKIILLSLVRSNVEGKVGFLRTENRVCVALSRAKHGLYVTGNIDLLSETSELWKKIRTDLENMGSIGKYLTLKCENHPDQVSTVSSGQDFYTKSPDGGCLQVCGVPLPKCQHLCPRVCHMDDREHKECKCQESCPKTLCSLDHKCPRKCWETCGPCMVMMDKMLPCSHTHNIACHIDPEEYHCTTVLNKELPCGHTANMPCHINPQNYDCLTKVEKEIPACEHKVTMECYRDPEKYTCPEDCDTRLDCGHKCRNLCHRTSDPDHLQYDCREECTKMNADCTHNHPCLKRCYERCGNCTVMIDKILPCGHEAKKIECSRPVEKVQCERKCKRTHPCGHACKRQCCVPCGDCTVMVKKTVPGCNHTIAIECGRPASTKECYSRCPKELLCGHPCLATCREVCTQECPMLVSTDNRCPKGHTIKLPCHLSAKVTGEAAWTFCGAPCGQLLDCGHDCVGCCSRCLFGRLHVSCNKPCNKTLVCGHVCHQPCGSACPPCQEQCCRWCSHGPCRKKCGQPCNPCREKCDWACEHAKCGNLCGDHCSRKPCRKPCKKQLQCGHLCVGFCGDPCPPLCRECDRDQLTKGNLLGKEGVEDARFVLLEDCEHCIEVNCLEGWLGQEDGKIGMKTCPRCRTPIYNNRRYQNIILQTYQTVRTVREKFLPPKTPIIRRNIEFTLRDWSILNTFQSECVQLFKKLGIGPRNQSKYLSVRELKVCHFQAQVLKKAASILLQGEKFARHCFFRRSSDPYFGYLLTPIVKSIVSLVMSKVGIITPQMEREVSFELQRLMILPAYWDLQETAMSDTEEEINHIKAQLKELMDPTVVFNDALEQKVRSLLKESKKHVVGLEINQSEKVIILKSMGLRRGHWYKCPHGHIYCITECGGATEESACPECKMVIGGGNHAQRPDHAVDKEMHRAQHAA